jgi:DNA-binding NtrC family response regulator
MCQRVAMLCEGPRVESIDLGLDPATMLMQPVDIDPPQTNGIVHGLKFDFDSGIHRAEDVERELIIQALHRTRGNVSKAAKLIGMQRSSFRYRIDRYGLQSLAQDLART